jgi:NAD(P)-dependent dehydrogenase (short-subunit alcohol dehydrogenase family)
MRLPDKIAVVFGAGQLPGRDVGNGKAAAVLFAREGAKVLAVDRNEAAAADVVAEILAAGGEAEAFVADVSDESAVTDALARCLSRWGRLDILHNNVGVSALAGDDVLTDISADAFDRVMAINLRGPVFSCKHAIPIMQRQQSGSIINISSVAATNRHRTVAYKLSKAAVLALSNHIAIEYADDGIRCNTILPGQINTPMAIEHRIAEWNVSYEQIIEMRNAAVPLRGPAGTGWDVGRAAVFLASDEARFISGASITVDGAQSLQIGRAPFAAESAQQTPG